MLTRLRARLAQWLHPSFEPTVARRVHRIEKDLHELTEQHDEVFRQLRLLQAGVDGLVRAAYVDTASLSYPERLTASRFRLLSQNQEDGILWALFKQIGVTTQAIRRVGKRGFRRQCCDAGR